MKQNMMALVFGMLGAFMFTTLHNYLYSKPIATVELEPILARHLQGKDLQSMSVEAQAKSSQRFAKALESVLNEVSTEQRVTLLLKKAVVSDVPDYTEYVQDQVQRILNETEN